ncbi:polysaccharide pyruvyl transferase [Propionicimonas paludicola]|uniref:Polysaccharide pyruvyl transferase n=1 Tax=Propionicimonas paludicola TaxID=185243 RepID=A0A2A9CTH9_9ACTN|nr:polysaccharide pyruvyl transferase family protein [Propionicimonas paludicola]PFG17461.1 polysaccharide pyruvyl transferase [Propionicimonas paludicola]
MHPDRPLQAIIRTTSLHGGNYGGVLQAYALQTAVRSLGIEAATDESTPIASRQHALAQLAQRAVSRIGGPPLTDGAALRKVHAALDPFVASKLRTVSLYRLGSQPVPARLDGVGQYIVGSDQVWRPNPWLDSLCLDFLGDDPAPRRVAYGVSFGVDTLEEGERGRLEARGPLIRRFAAVSVREESGVQLCQDLWGVRAQWVIDPVLLLPADHYLDLIGAEERAGTGLLTYVLDDSAAKGALIAEAAARLDLPVMVAAPPEVRSARDYRAEPQRWQRPSMETWLSGFTRAEFVVTDSFHGVVLSLLFGKQFLAIGNVDRGLTRFESLLGRVGLRSRLICEGDPLPDLGEPIAWDGVRAAIADQRATSWDFLSRSLDVDGASRFRS